MRVSLELINLVGAQDISGTLDNDPIIRQLEQQNFQKLKADFQFTIASICKDNNKQQKITIKPFMDYSKEHQFEVHLSRRSHWRSGTARGFLPQGCGFVSHPVDRLSTEPVCVGSRLHKPVVYTKRPGGHR